MTCTTIIIHSYWFFTNHSTFYMFTVKITPNTSWIIYPLIICIKSFRNKFSIFSISIRLPNIGSPIFIVRIWVIGSLLSSQWNLWVLLFSLAPSQTWFVILLSWNNNFSMNCCSSNEWIIINEESPTYCLQIFPASFVVFNKLLWKTRIKLHDLNVLIRTFDKTLKIKGEWEKLPPRATAWSWCHSIELDE